MGSFKVQLTPTTTLAEARDIGNDMVENRNKNNKLYLDEAARRILNGTTPRLDFSGLSEAERKAIYDGRGLGDAGPLPMDPTPSTEPAPDTTETTTEVTEPSTPEETTPSSDAGGHHGDHGRVRGGVDRHVGIGEAPADPDDGQERSSRPEGQQEPAGPPDETSGDTTSGG